ncbi:MAG: PAS domain S-box protein, partial [Burkholderiales bacterium]|nr:PAS domain S-box protein [Burkholderiales bacterium]
MAAGESSGGTRQPPSIRRALLERFIVLIVLASFVFSAALYFLVIKPSADEVGAGQMLRAAQLVEGKIGAVVEQVERVALTARDWGMSGEFDIADVRGFNRLFMPVLENDPQLTTAILADDRGRELLLFQMPDGEWHNRVTDIMSWGTRKRLIRWRGLDDLIDEQWVEQDYDPRLRPWHAGAMGLAGERDVFWTEPYMFFTSKEPGITVATRWRGQPGATYVFALDAKLIDISRFTTALRVSEHGRTALLTNDGRIVGVPGHSGIETDDDIKRVVMKTPVEAGFGEYALALTRWEQAGRPHDLAGRFEADDGHWLFRFYPARLGSARLILATIAPADDFLPDALRQAAGSFVLVLFGVLAIGVASAAVVARRFSAPLEELARESRRLGALDMDRPITTTSELREVDVLADAQERMRQALLASTEALERSNRELEARVEQRTRELSEREAHFRAIFENTGVGIITRSRGRGIIGVNNAYLEFLGYAREELESLDASAFMTPEDRERVASSLARMEAGDLSVYRMERRYRRKDGAMRWGDVMTSAIRDDGGRLMATVTMVSDITERKEAAALLQSIIDGIPVPMFYKGADTRYLGCNRAYREAFGIRREDFIGRRVLDLAYLPEAERTAYQAEDERVIADGLMLHKEVQMQFADGTVHDTLYSVSGFRTGDGAPGGLVGVIVDVTELRRTQEALKEARDAAEEATRAKSMFLANMSHEIRTPMNAVIGMSHLALKTSLDARQRDYVQKIHNAGTSLLGIINDILDFSKIEAGRLEVENVAMVLDEVMANVSTVVAQKVFDKGLELLFDMASDVPQNLIGDPLRLGQILINLVNNAVKFTERGEVSVRVRVMERYGGKTKLEFSVRDTGIGMTPEQTARLFQA